MHVLIERTSENCKSLVLQDKCNIEVLLSPEDIIILEKCEVYSTKKQ